MYKKISFLVKRLPIGLSISPKLKKFLTLNRLNFVKGHNFKLKSKSRRNSFREVSIDLDYKKGSNWRTRYLNFLITTFGKRSYDELLHDFRVGDLVFSSEYQQDLSRKFVLLKYVEGDTDVMTRKGLIGQYGVKSKESIKKGDPLFVYPGSYQIKFNEHGKPEIFVEPSEIDCSPSFLPTRVNDPFDDASQINLDLVNVEVKFMHIDDGLPPQLIMVAKKDIKPGDTLWFDYGDSFDFDKLDYSFNLPFEEIVMTPKKPLRRMSSEVIPVLCDVESELSLYLQDSQLFSGHKIVNLDKSGQSLLYNFKKSHFVLISHFERDKSKLESGFSLLKLCKDKTMYSVLGLSTDLELFLSYVYNRIGNSLDKVGSKRFDLQLDKIYLVTHKGIASKLNELFKVPTKDEEYVYCSNFLKMDTAKYDDELCQSSRLHVFPETLDESSGVARSSEFGTSLGGGSAKPVRLEAFSETRVERGGAATSSELETMLIAQNSFLDIGACEVAIPDTLQQRVTQKRQSSELVHTKIKVLKQNKSTDFEQRMLEDLSHSLMDTGAASESSTDVFDDSGIGLGCIYKVDLYKQCISSNEMTRQLKYVRLLPGKQAFLDDYMRSAHLAIEYFDSSLADARLLDVKVFHLHHPGLKPFILDFLFLSSVDNFVEWVANDLTCEGLREFKHKFQSEQVHIYFVNSENFIRDIESQLGSDFIENKL